MTISQREHKRCRFVQSVYVVACVVNTPHFLFELTNAVALKGLYKVTGISGTVTKVFELQLGL